MTIRPIDIRRLDVSVKRRFDETTFRENDVAPFDTLAGPEIYILFSTL